MSITTPLRHTCAPSDSGLWVPKLKDEVGLAMLKPDYADAETTKAFARDLAEYGLTTIHRNPLILPKSLIDTFTAIPRARTFTPT